MARPLRIEFDGAIYHVMSRGDRRENIFRGDEDRLQFLTMLEGACKKTAWQVHAYCLMGNHFHMVVETPQPNLVAGMKWLLGVYTQAFNRRHSLWGHLFGGRYKAILIDGTERGYLRTACDYVHLNPKRAGLIKEGAGLEEYRWSSYPSYLVAEGKRPKYLRVDRLMGEHGLEKDTARARREFAARTASLMEEGEKEEELRGLRRGWLHGADDFLERLLEKVEVGAKEGHQGREKSETDEQKAERIVREELGRRKWGEEDLAKRRKGDRGKAEIALRLRAETPMTLKWVAERLKMGTWTHVSNCLSALKRKKNRRAKS